MGNPLTYPGYVDVYDVNEDCRDQKLNGESEGRACSDTRAALLRTAKTYYAKSLFSGKEKEVEFTKKKRERIR